MCGKIISKRKTTEIKVKIVNIVQLARGNPNLIDSGFMQCQQFLFINFLAFFNPLNLN